MERMNGLKFKNVLLHGLQAVIIPGYKTVDFSRVRIDVGDICQQLLIRVITMSSSEQTIKQSGSSKPSLKLNNPSYETVDNNTLVETRELVQRPSVSLVALPYDKK